MWKKEANITAGLLRKVYCLILWALCYIVRSIFQVSRIWVVPAFVLNEIAKGFYASVLDERKFRISNDWTYRFRKLRGVDTISARYWVKDVIKGRFWIGQVSIWSYTQNPIVSESDISLYERMTIWPLDSAVGG